MLYLVKRGRIQVMRRADIQQALIGGMLGSLEYIYIYSKIKVLGAIVVHLYFPRRLIKIDGGLTGTE